jgi:hypothetical protein
MKNLKVTKKDKSQKVCDSIMEILAIVPIVAFAYYIGAMLLKLI